MEFKDKLKTLRKKAGITQNELAQQIYVSRSAIARWENGFGLPGEESLNLLAQYFNVGTGELIGNTEAETLLIGKNRIIARKNIIIAAVTAVSLAIIILLSVLFFAPFGSSRSYSVVVDGVRYELVEDDGEYYAVWGLENYKIVGNQKYKRIIAIADEINKIPVRTVAQYAFYDVSCDEFYFGKNIERIEYGAFEKASIFGNLYFEGCNNLIEIEEAAFYQCHFNRTSIRLPDSLKNLHSGAFVGCGGLSEIGFGRGANGTLTIENGAISCSSLEKVEFGGPAQVGGFGSCYNLREIGIFWDVSFTDGYNSFYSLYNLEIVRYYGTYKEFIEKYEHVFYGEDFRIIASDYDGPIIWDNYDDGLVS